jgi:hypothetical protein
MPISQPQDEAPPIQPAIFDVQDWQRDEQYAVYPVGSRPKELLVAPGESVSPLIRPKHRYLLKASNPNFPAQYWAEVIAYRIGLAVGVAVPPAYAAIDTRRGIRGALIEWFYEFPDTGPIITRYVPGLDYLKRVIPDFDLKTGRQHNLKSVLAILRPLRKRGLASPLVFWARVLAFDALIGNTDRHQENWGILWTWRSAEPHATFAPAFDNGSSLGYEWADSALPRFQDRGVLDRYIAKGRHHCGGSSGAAGWATSQCCGSWRTSTPSRVRKSGKSRPRPLNGSRPRSRTWRRSHGERSSLARVSISS